MEVEYNKNIILNNKNFNICDFYNKFTEISDTKIIINNKDILVDKNLLAKHSKFFYNIITDYPTNNIYNLNIDYKINHIENVLSYLYGCDLIINIDDFNIYYSIAEYLRIDELINDLRKNLKDGFENNKYDPQISLQMINFIYYNFYDDDLNNILFDTIANNFKLLHDQLYFSDIDILKNIISKNNLNINSEQDLISFLNYYYVLHQDDKLNIDIKLIPHIRLLTLNKKK